MSETTCNYTIVLTLHVLWLHRIEHGGFLVKKGESLFSLRMISRDDDGNVFFRSSFLSPSSYFKAFSRFRIMRIWFATVIVCDMGSTEWSMMLMPYSIDSLSSKSVTGSA